MNWEKLKPSHFFAEPVKHVYVSGIFDTKQYDALYENQLKPSHRTWQEFDSKYKIGYEVKDNFESIDYNKEVMCLWFFKERSHNTPAQINLSGKQLAYFPNTFLITESKDIKFETPKKKFIRYPVVQLDLSLETWQNILKRFDKI